MVNSDFKRVVYPSYLKQHILLRQQQQQWVSPCTEETLAALFYNCRWATEIHKHWSPAVSIVGLQAFSFPSLYKFLKVHQHLDHDDTIVRTSLNTWDCELSEQQRTQGLKYGKWHRYIPELVRKKDDSCRLSARIWEPSVESPLLVEEFQLEGLQYSNPCLETALFLFELWLVYKGDKDYKDVEKDLLDRTQQLLRLEAIIRYIHISLVLITTLTTYVKKRLKSVSASMPWTIPPVLLVLWSVVWMFIYPGHVNNLDPSSFQFLDNENYYLNLPDGYFNDLSSPLAMFTYGSSGHTDFSDPPQLGPSEEPAQSSSPEMPPKPSGHSDTYDPGLRVVVGAKPPSQLDIDTAQGLLVSLPQQHIGESVTLPVQDMDSSKDRDTDSIQRQAMHKPRYKQTPYIYFFKPVLPCLR